MVPTVLIVLAVLPQVLTAGQVVAVRAATVAGLLVFVGLWAGFWLWAVDSPSPHASPVVIAGLTAVLVPLTMISPPGADGLVFAAAAAGAGLRARRAVPVVIAISLLAGSIQLLLGTPAPGAIGRVANDLVVGFVAIGGRILLLTNRDLHAAREEIARLAVSEERLRVARDLHDLVGQNLTVAVLKSELVARELPESTDQRLRDELADLAAAVRRSLDDVREAVIGYRQPGIGTELANARSALRAAGISLSVEDTLGPVPTVQEGVLAWVVREGVTNVLKHSCASRCAVRLRREPASAVLELEDDGVGEESEGTGSGLRGISERVAAVGGSFHACGEQGAGFRLMVSVPLRP
jgi:two-component system sensor histidine kinase DesK